MTIGLFAEDLLEVFEHYKRAFNAALIYTDKGSQNELIHLEMDIMGMKMWVQPTAPGDINKHNNVMMLGLKFVDANSLKQAHEVLKEECISDGGLDKYPWSPLQGLITDKFGVRWCIGL